MIFNEKKRTFLCRKGFTFLYPLPLLSCIHLSTKIVDKYVDGS
ncbi:hypothetical protein VCHE25_2033 [Vibrio cholerae HE-25]|nr:hypothetical protein VIH_001908 [Vibrio cholerae CT 5369-93]EJH61856.1 hypothetical protein VCHE25_2033 [Vibrio cholerae HE-25]EMQ69417.1 hypothetical protein VCNHCC008D_000930 [Vibrio cholerae O1 str. NHCC-008D]